jgi:hypothetical protein
MIRACWKNVRPWRGAVRRRAHLLRSADEANAVHHALQMGSMRARA